MFNKKNEITMNREQIEKAGRDYALDQLEIVGLPGRAEAMKAFVASAPNGVSTRCGMMQAKFRKLISVCWYVLKM